MAEKEYIERDSIYRRVKAYTNPYGKPMLDYKSGIKVLDMIKQEPAADVVPVVHGRWITDENTEGYMGDTQCTACKGFLGEYDMYICKPGENSFFYCPNCGAKMDGATDNNVGDKGGERKE